MCILLNLFPLKPYMFDTKFRLLTDINLFLNVEEIIYCRLFKENVKIIVYFNWISKT